MEKRDKKIRPGTCPRSSKPLAGYTCRTDQCQECGRFRLFMSVVQHPNAMWPPPTNDPCDSEVRANGGYGSAREEYDWERAWDDHLARARAEKPKNPRKQSEQAAARGAFVRLRCPRCRSRLKLERHRADRLRDTALVVCPECHSPLRLGRKGR